MDLHVLIVIACVFLVSLFSLLFINKFFRGKTFEEVAAEKRLLAEKLYGPSKAKQRQQRKLSNKKEMKKDKKEKKSKDTTTGGAASVPLTKENDIDSQNDSDLHSETQSESSPLHQNKKVHVEFVEPEVVEDVNAVQSNQQKISNDKKKEKQRKLSNSKPSGHGILVNKSEPIIVKETLTAEPLNHFSVKPPKDVVEMKKKTKENLHSGKDSADSIEINLSQNENKIVKDGKTKDAKKSSKASKKEDKEKGESVSQNQQQQQQLHQQQQHSQQTVQEPTTVKEIKQHEEKMIKTGGNDSPKVQNKKQQHQKKKIEISIIDQLKSGTDIIGVNTLMMLFNQAELNRNEIQILIDYLLNKQQDASVNHSEWSDDVVQKLKKQLNDKEKALQEEQEASIGLQAKLRDLRTEINTERVHFNATTKMYMEKLQIKDAEIANLNQDIQNLNDKFNLERQQFQSQLHREKQASTQELLGQIQQLNDHINRLKSEIVQLQMIANASHQTAEETKQKMNEIVQQQQQKILALEQNLNDAKEEIARQQYDLEMAKIVENEKEANKVEIRNLQNALDSTKSELNLAQNEIKDSQMNLESLNKQIENFKTQIETANIKYFEQSQSYEKIKITLAEYQNFVNDKDKKLSEYEIRIKQLTSQEDELMKQINEQKEKNNELRTKNWKLVEALQKAETTSASSTTVDNRTYNNLVTQTDITKDEKRIRELFERLYPEAVKSILSSSLTLTFDQWIEQVVSTHVKQFLNNNSNKTMNLDNNKNLNSCSNCSSMMNTSSSTNSNSSNKNKNMTTQTTNSSYNDEDDKQKQHNNNNNNNHVNNSSDGCSSGSSSSDCKDRNSNKMRAISITTTVKKNQFFDTEKTSSSSNYDDDQDDQETETKQLLLQNAQLRAKVEQLTSIVTKTENLLTNLETQARDQEAHWRNVVQSKEEEIHFLKYLIKNPNGQEI